MGDYLRNARRQRRVSIDRAAEQTRIRADYLMRMESDEFDFLAPAYVRGFLRTYARFLRVGEEPLIEEFDRRFGRARSDPSQIVALERRTRSAPREKRPLSSWTVAASLAAIFLVILGVIGIVSGPEDEPSSDRIASIDDRTTPTPEETQEEAPEATPTPTPTITASPTPTATPTDDGALAFADGIELEILASSGACWVNVSTDGSPTAIFSETIPLGGSETFTATESMTVVLGFPDGVELIVNGTNIGSPGGANPVTLQLPDDVGNF